MSTPLSPSSPAPSGIGEPARGLAQSLGVAVDIQRAELPFKLGGGGVLRMFKQMMVTENVVELNSHYFDSEFQSLGYINIEDLFNLDNGSSFKAKVVAMVEAYEREFELANPKARSEVYNYFDRVSKWNGSNVDEIPIGSGMSTKGMVQLAEVKIDPRRKTSGRTDRRTIAYMFDWSITEAEFRQRSCFPGRKPFFHALNGTYTPNGGMNFHSRVTTSVKFSGTNVWGTGNNFEMFCHEISFLAKRRLIDGIIQETAETMKEMIVTDISHTFQGCLGSARDINWNNLAKESPFINRSTRGFCAMAMAVALGASLDSVAAAAGLAGITPEQAGAEAERANEALRSQGVTTDKIKIVKDACALVHRSTCVFWDESWGRIPESVGRLRYGLINQERTAAAYGHKKTKAGA